jgi:deoxyadenosine/deoxycytidine kinase
MSSRWVFWPVLFKKGMVTKKEDETYGKFYDQYAWYPDLYIFLSKDLDLAWDHIQNRYQTGDTGVSREYLAELGEEYHKMIKSVPCRVHIVNANRSVEEIHKEICGILSDNELFVGDALRSQVQKEGGSGRKMSCTPFTNMCRLS